MESVLNVHHPAFLGGFLFIISAPMYFVVPQDVSIAIAAVTLSLIADAFIGFEAQANDLRTMVLELLIAALFLELLYAL